MLYLQLKDLLYPVILSQIHFVWNEVEGEFLWSSLWEHLSLQAISSWEKNKKKENAESGLKHNKYWGKKAGSALNLHQIGGFIHNAWNNECMLGYHFLSYSVCLFKILKQKNHSQRRNSVFCFSWKVEKMQIQHFVLWPTNYIKVSYN